MFLTGCAAPLAARAGTPIGFFDGIDSNGTISGWAIDVDAPAVSIDVHIYMDGPADGGGKLIGVANAVLPRPDVNQATGYPGAHGFNYSLPPVTRDGVNHSYYVYGIDTSRIGSENQLLSGAPRASSLPSTIVRMDNGTIQVGIEPRCGGTIAEIMLNGENLVNNYDCTGRQIQVAQYDGNSTYDACAGCSGTWGWDPVQGGDRNGFGSIVIAQSVTRNGIYIKTQPYQWFPEDKGGGAGRPVFSDVIVEQWLSFVPGAPLAIKLHSKISHDGNDNHALAAQEFPATYINQGFDKLVYYGGVSPWTGEPVRIATAQAGIVYNAAENWAAFVDNRGSGLTVYVPGQYPYMSAFRLDDPVSGPYSNGFNYFTPFVPFEFKAGSVLEGDIYLIAGDYESARQFIYGLRSSMETADFLPPFGFLDAPASSQMLSETASVAGWVFDNGSLGRIEVLVDGTLAGTATYGYPRPDVASVFPNIDANTGYLYLLDTTKYSNGQHTITVKAFDAVGNMADLTKSVAVNFSNAAPVPPPAKLSLGDRIQITARRVSVKSAPGGIRIGRQAMNAYGTLVRGPVSQGGFTWWSIDFDRNPDGWVAENYFKKITLPAK